MSAKDAIKKFNVQLLKQLPLDDDMFFAMAKQADLFPLDTGDSIAAKPTRAKKVSYFLQHVAEPGAEEYLPKLLKVMKESKVANVVKLADDIKAAKRIEPHNETKHGYSSKDTKSENSQSHDISYGSSCKTKHKGHKDELPRSRERRSRSRNWRSISRERSRSRTRDRRFRSRTRKSISKDRRSRSRKCRSRSMERRSRISQSKERSHWKRRSRSRERRSRSRERRPRERKSVSRKVKSKSKERRSRSRSRGRRSWSRDKRHRERRFRSRENSSSYFKRQKQYYISTSTHKTYTAKM